MTSIKTIKTLKILAASAAACLSTFSFASQANEPIDENDFDIGRASCKTFQYEGITDDGRGCLVNIGFGRSSSFRRPCVPTEIGSGNLIIPSKDRATEVAEVLGGSLAKGEFQERSHRYDWQTGYALVAKNAFHYDADTAVLTLVVKGQLHNADDLTIIEPRAFYKVGAPIEGGAVERTYTCTLKGAATYPIDGNVD